MTRVTEPTWPHSEYAFEDAATGDQATVTLPDGTHAGGTVVTVKHDEDGVCVKYEVALNRDGERTFLWVDLFTHNRLYGDPDAAAQYAAFLDQD